MFTTVGPPRMWLRYALTYLLLYLSFYNLLKKCVTAFCRSFMASKNEWLGAFQQYDFDNAYFNNVASNDACDDNDNDWTDSECDSEEAEFNLVNPIVGEIYAYMQWHFDKQPMCTC